MGKKSWKAWALVWALGSGCWVAWTGPFDAMAAESVRSELIHPVADASQKSWTESVGSGFKKGFNSVTGVFKPSKTPVTPSDDPISLNTKSHASPQTRIAMAKLFEDAGRYPEATEQYRLALADSPKDIRILMGFARIKARTGDLVEATKLLEQAASISPGDSAVLNNLGMCLAQRKMHKEALGALQQAVQLQPGNPLYRNNLATLMIEMGQNDAALAQLRAVNSEAVARYNLGYLLKKKGQSAEAAQQFAQAWKLDPSLTQARYWAEQLGAAPVTSPEPSSDQSPSLATHPRRPVSSEPESALRPATPATLPSSASAAEGSMPSVAGTPSWRLGQNSRVERLPPLSSGSDYRR